MIDYITLPQKTVNTKVLPAHKELPPSGRFCCKLSPMALRSELAISWDEKMHPIAARCTWCGDPIPQPEPGLTDAAEIVLWFSKAFLDHKRVKHPNSQRVTEDPVAS